MPGEPSSINMAINVVGGEHGRGRLVRQLTLEQVIKWIGYLELDDYTTKGLIELASKYPTQALPQFRKNFNVMLNRVRAQRKKETKGEPENANKTNQEVASQESFDENEIQAPVTNIDEGINSWPTAPVSPVIED